MNTKLLIGSTAAVLLVLFFVTRQTQRDETAAASAQPTQPDVRSDRTPDRDSAVNDNTGPGLNQTRPPPAPTQAEQGAAVPAPVLLEPEYGSPTYLDVRDEAARRGAGYRGVPPVRTRIARVNWEALVAAVRSLENGDRTLNPPLELAPFDELSCTLSSVARFQNVRQGKFMLSFSRCDGNNDSDYIMLNIDPSLQVFSGTAAIRGSWFDLVSLPHGHMLAIQNSPSSDPPAELN